MVKIIKDKYSIFEKEINRIKRSGRRYYIEGYRAKNSFGSPKEALSLLYKIGASRTWHLSGCPQKTGSYRSFPDLYKIVLYYFPDATPLDMIEAMNIGNWNNRNASLYPSYCSDVKKVVYSGVRSSRSSFDYNANCGIKSIKTSEIPELARMYEKQYRPKDKEASIG